MIPPQRTYKQQLKVYESQTRDGGLYRMHGFRHRHALDRYEEITGWKAPAACGPERRSLTGARRRIDTAARRTITEELGHSRLAWRGSVWGRDPASAEEPMIGQSGPEVAQMRRCADGKCSFRPCPCERTPRRSARPALATRARGAVDHASRRLARTQLARVVPMPCRVGPRQDGARKRLQRRPRGTAFSGVPSTFTLTGGAHRP